MTRVGDGEEYELRPTGGEPVYNVNEPKEASIVDWRAECFERLGFTPLAAATLAARRDVDREQVARMIRGGATPPQVVAVVL